MGAMFVEAGRHMATSALPNVSHLPAIERKHEHRRKISVVRWTVQGMLALLFLFAGSMNLATAPGVLAAMTTLAATCQAVEMIGATATSLAVGGGATALMPLVVGLLAAFLAYGRCRMARQTASSGRPAVASAYLIF